MKGDFFDFLAGRADSENDKLTRAVESGHGDCCNVLDAGNALKNLFDFSGTDFDAAKIHSVIGAAKRPPPALGQFFHEITVTSQRLTRWPDRHSVVIGLPVILIEESGGQADRRGDEEKFAARGSLAAVIDDDKVEAESRGVESSRITGLGDGSGDIGSADLGAAAVFDDRFAAAEPHEPAHVVGVGTLTGGTKKTNGAPIKAIHTGAVAPGFDQAGNDPKHRRAGVLDELAELATSGRAVIDTDGSMIEESGKDQPWTHHPTEVSGPDENVAGVDILMEMSVCSAFDGCDLSPWNELGFASGAGRE